ncbi:MAG TPA: Xaa-Pro peptidase family protein [Xanthobacteraceae bacterium]|nr:Xaa-Pro peptidase family protein [Xanthobacteraceae bacterium]
MLTSVKPTASSIPFDTKRLDSLMEDAGIDVLLATSKHNVQYLLGGHRAFFFDYMDAMGLSRYLPIVVYSKGAPDRAAFFGHRLENFQREVKAFWTPEQNCTSSGSVDVMKKAVEHIKKVGSVKRVGVEMAFLPMDAATALRSALPDATIVDALFVLERLRALKSPAELEMVRIASERVIESMQAVIAKHGPGTTKQELADALKVEETNRGLTFEYCLIAAGASHNRAPSDQRWEEGDVLSVDSGGNFHGYIGDLARMAILGEPDAELVDLLGEIEAIQRASMKPVKAGVMGGEIYASAEALLAKSKQHNHMHFLAHGMGLVSHEAPRLTATGPVPYDAYDATRPLETGMVVSVETTLQHPKRGFIKLEDTIAVTDTGYEIYGEGARGWNRGGAARGR